jgi:two-component system, NarL family, sensor histidine kinase NreB
MESLTFNKRITAYIIQAQEEEIKRLSSELHEGIAQTLYGMFTGLQFIQSCVDNPSLKQYIEEMIHLSKRTIEEIRWISTELHPLVLDTHGLLPAIHSYCKIYTQTFGILVEIEVRGEPQRLSSNLENSLFRICQETLFNSAKYADTDKVKMTFDWTDDELTILIEDFGVGFDLSVVRASGRSLGIEAMQQRTELIGGRFLIKSASGTGTSVQLSIPVEFQDDTLIDIKGSE